MSKEYGLGYIPKAQHGIKTWSLGNGCLMQSFLMYLPEIASRQR
jgi:hypothetical protein